MPKNGEIIEKEMIKWEIKIENLKLTNYVSICYASSIVKGLGSVKIYILTV